MWSISSWLRWPYHPGQLYAGNLVEALVVHVGEIAMVCPKE
jgi:hypothetical protein